MPFTTGSAADTRGVFVVPDDRLEVDVHQLVREVLLAEEVDEAGEAVRRALVEVAADGDAGTAGDAPDVLDEPIERALSAAKRPHAVVRVAIAVERDLDAPQPVRQQSIDHLGRQQQSVGDDADLHRHAAQLRASPELLGEVIHDREIQERLAAEKREHECSRDARDRARAQSSPQPSRPSRASSCRQTCCNRRDRPGSSSRTRSCTAAW